MGPKLLRGEIELCRKLNLSELLGNELLGNTNPSSACAKSHWNFCPGAAQLEQDPPRVGTTSIPGQSLELRKTETPKSKKKIQNPTEPRCDRTFLIPPSPPHRNCFHQGWEQRQAPSVLVPNPEFLAPYTARSTHLSPNPFHLSPGTANKELDTILFACTHCRGEWS